MTSFINHSEYNSNINFLDYDCLRGCFALGLRGDCSSLGDFFADRLAASVVKNPYRDKNIHLIIFFIVPISSIAAIVLMPPAACRRFSPDQGDRRLAAESLMVLIILINALCARSTSFFPNPAASLKSEFIIYNVSLSDVCLTDLSKVGQFRCIWCLV